MKSGWQTKTLGEVCVVDWGNTDLTKSAYVEGGKYLAVSAAGCDGRIGHKEHSRHTPVLSAIGAQCGRMFLPDEDFTAIKNTITLTPRDGVCTGPFLYQLLTHIELPKRGAAQPFIAKGDIQKFPIPLPPLPEQQRIVGILDEAFAGIATAKANAEKNLQNAHALFESHLHAVFTHRGPGWVEKTFADLCDIKHGYPFEGEFFASEGDYVLLTPGNFHEEGGYRDRGEKQKYYTGEIPRDYVLKEGDMLVAMTEQAAGLLGSPLLVPESDKFLHNQRLGLIIPKAGVPWTNEFFFYAFNTRPVRQAIHDSASGVKVRHTSPTKIGEVAVAFPTSVAEQRRITARFDALQTETRRLEALAAKKLAALDELKAALLHQAFSGQL